MGGARLDQFVAVELYHRRVVAGSELLGHRLGDPAYLGQRGRWRLVDLHALGGQLRARAGGRIAVHVALAGGGFGQAALLRYVNGQNDPALWLALQREMATLFARHDRAHWCVLLEGSDAYWAPVLPPDEAAALLGHVVARSSRGVGAGHAYPRGACQPGLHGTGDRLPAGPGLTPFLAIAVDALKQRIRAFGATPRHTRWRRGLAQRFRFALLGYQLSDHFAGVANC